jgi:hypothetical protein
MGAKAGIDVEQLYRIVNGAAGASWMFTDRGKRMLSDDPEVKSALNIFVKDLDIVYAEAKKLMCPIPVASAALQQFISGQSLGFGKLDDSMVVKVYENTTKVPVVSQKGPVAEERKLDLALCNEFVKVFRVNNRSIGSPDCYTPTQDKLCLNLEVAAIEVEVLKCPPVKQTAQLDAVKHEIVKSFERFRVYKFALGPGESVTVTYPFFHLTLALTAGELETAVLTKDDQTTLTWTQTYETGSLQWKVPASLGSQVA